MRLYRSSSQAYNLYKGFCLYKSCCFANQMLSIKAKPYPLGPEPGSAWFSVSNTPRKREALVPPEDYLKLNSMKN